MGFKGNERFLEYSIKTLQDTTLTRHGDRFPHIRSS